MNLNPPNPSMHEQYGAAASMQLVSFAAAIGGVLLGAMLLAVWVAWARRRRSESARDKYPDRIEPGCAASDDRLRVPLAASGLLLVPVLLLAVFLLPSATVIRQLWPHPDLGWEMIVCWFAFLLPVVLAWMAVARTVVGRLRL